MKIKTRIELMADLINVQNSRVISCEVDITNYTRKTLVIKDAQQSAVYESKLKELKAIKERAEETIKILTDMIKKEGIKS